MTTPAASAPTQFKEACRRWRQHRKLSQLELSLAAGVSQRHISWLETGRSQPSREMVIRLSEAMEIPLRERNVLLQSAGYSALYTEKRLDEPVMQPVLEALHRILEHHDPYPAVAVDRFWNVKMQNVAAGLLFGLAGDPAALMEKLGEGRDINLALLSLHPEGLRPYIANWEQVAPSFVRRLRREALASGDPLVHERFERFIALAGPIADSDASSGALLPVLPLKIAVGDRILGFFGIITTLGTPQDVTADELRVEAFHPADPATEEFLRGVAGGAR